MSGVDRQRASLGQGKGPDVELIVSGTRIYSTYETLDGYPAVYDDSSELYCYARLTSAGAFESTGVPISGPAPAELRPHLSESDDVRATKIETRLAQVEIPAIGDDQVKSERRTP
jgi:hypothetical protein